MSQARFPDGLRADAGSTMTSVTMTSLAVSAGIDRSNLTQDDLAKYAIPFECFRVHDAPSSLLPAAGAADDLGIYGTTFGTDSIYLATQDLKAAGATSEYARVSVPLPVEYVSGETITIRCYSGMITTISDTTATIDIECYKSDDEGGTGSDLCTTAAQSINSLTFANKDFVITPTGMAAGDVLDIRVKIAVNDAATGTAVIGACGRFSLLCDVKG